MFNDDNDLQEDSLEDTQDRISINADDTWEYLKDAVTELIKSCE